MSTMLREDFEGASRKSLNTSPLTMVRVTGEGCQSEEVSVLVVPKDEKKKKKFKNSGECSNKQRMLQYCIQYPPLPPKKRNYSLKDCGQHCGKLC